MKTKIFLLAGLLALAACGGEQAPVTSDAASGTAAPLATPAAAPLHLEVYTSPASGFSVTSTLVYGERELILIDPQFLLSEARQVAERIKATGRELTTVYTTHAHPDHFFGIEVMKQEFPNLRFVALPGVASSIETAWPARRNFWLPTFGDDLPGEMPILPEPVEGMLLLEGHELHLIGEVYGDGPGNTFVHIPDLDAVIAGDIVFNQSHFAPPEDPAPLFETLNRIAALNPTLLVAGHQAQGAEPDPGAIEFMRNYIADFDTFRAESASAEELTQKMQTKYPGLALEVLLTSSAGRAFAPPQEQ